MIPVTELRIDTEYQRGLNGSRVDTLAKEWDWVACGCLIVALRGAGSGEYFVIDGQHRLGGAKRAGILELPCLVFESQTHKDEARGFLNTNMNRRSMSILDRYRALLVVGDPVASKTKELLEIAGRTPQEGVSGNRGGEAVRCIGYIMSAVQTDQETLERLWPLVIQITESRLLVKRLLQGLFYIERYLSNTSLLERHWRKRLLTIGYDVLCRSIDETCTYEGKSGAAICAQGVLRAINRGLRNKLEVTVTEKDIKDEAE